MRKKTSIFGHTSILTFALLSFSHDSLSDCGKLNLKSKALLPNFLKNFYETDEAHSQTSSSDLSNSNNPESDPYSCSTQDTSNLFANLESDAKSNRLSIAQCRKLISSITHYSKKANPQFPDPCPSNLDSKQADHFLNKADHFLSSYQKTNLDQVDDTIKEKYLNVNSVHQKVYDQRSKDKKKLTPERVAKHLAEGALVDGPIEKTMEFVADGFHSAYLKAKKLKENRDNKQQSSNSSPSDSIPNSGESIKIQDLIPGDAMRIRYVKGAKGSLMVVFGSLGMTAGAVTGFAGGAGSIPFQATGLGIEGGFTIAEHLLASRGNAVHSKLLKGFRPPASRMAYIPGEISEQALIDSSEETVDESSASTDASTDSKSHKKKHLRHHNDHKRSRQVRTGHHTAATSADMPLLHELPLHIAHSSGDHGVVPIEAGAHHLSAHQGSLAAASSHPPVEGAAHGAEGAGAAHGAAGATLHHTLQDVAHLSGAQQAAVIIPFIGSYYLVSNGAKNVYEALTQTETFPFILMGFEKLHEDIFSDAIEKKKEELKTLKRLAEVSLLGASDEEKKNIYSKLNCLCNAEAELDSLKTSGMEKFENRFKYLSYENERLKKRKSAKLAGQLNTEIKGLDSQNNNLRKFYNQFKDLNTELKLGELSVAKTEIPKNVKKDAEGTQTLRSTLNALQEENSQIMTQLSDAIATTTKSGIPSDLTFDYPDFNISKIPTPDEDILKAEVDYILTKNNLKNLRLEQKKRLKLIHAQLQEAIHDFNSPNNPNQDKTRLKALKTLQNRIKPYMK